MKFDCWIQAADFSMTNYTQQTVENALALFESCPWDDMIKLERELAEKKIEFAPPGFGIDHPEGHRLHLCPDPENNNCWMLYQPCLNRTIFGFIRRCDPEYESDKLKLSDVPEAIETFCTPDATDGYFQFVRAHGVLKP